MGKAKKLKRLEKAKVKLKAKKLPKGQNITDTSFKTRKIVIPEQLKQVNEEELLTRKKLNVKELLVHLKHHNTTVRQDGLSGLKELVMLHTDEVIRLHLPEVIDGVSQLILDLETDVRRNALKLIEAVLHKVSSEQVVPLFDVLQSYMACAMTHIKPSIQEDSLLLLDSLLEVCPHLIAQKAGKILPGFLDMISSLRNESRPDRTLLVNLNSKITSVRWRIKVLSRLSKFFDAVVREKKKKSQELSGGSNAEVKMVKWSELTPIYAAEHMSFGNRACRMPQVLFPSVMTSLSEANECEMLKNYIQALLPLLFETWIESAPEGKNVDDNILSHESALLLQCIVGTIQRLWEYLECWENDAKVNTLTEWFKAQYEKDLLKHFIPGFPYTLSPHSKSKKGEDSKQKRLAKNEQMLLQDIVITSPKCVQQNLSLCYLLICIHDRADKEVVKKVVTYVQECLTSWNNETLLSQLDLVLRALLLQKHLTWPLTDCILKCVVQRYQASSDEAFRYTLFCILCDVILQPECHDQLRCSEFEEWIGELPAMLCQPTISKKVVDTLMRLACQNNKIFLENLHRNYKSVIDSLTCIEVLDGSDPTDGLRSIVDILYRAGETDHVVFDCLLKSISKYPGKKDIIQYIQNCKTFQEVMCS